MEQGKRNMEKVESGKWRPGKIWRMQKVRECRTVRRLGADCQIVEWTIVINNKLNVARSFSSEYKRATLVLAPL